MSTWLSGLPWNWSAWEWTSPPPPPAFTHTCPVPAAEVGVIPCQPLVRSLDIRHRHRFLLISCHFQCVKVPCSIAKCPGLREGLSSLTQQPPPEDWGTLGGISTSWEALFLPVLDGDAKDVPSSMCAAFHGDSLQETAEGFIHKWMTLPGQDPGLPLPLIFPELVVSLSGTKGMPGYPGQTGRPGSPGYPSHEAGQKGVAGTKGAKGLPGFAGVQGPQGIPGFPGATGARVSTTSLLV